MGENSEISWTDHTFNAWIGCTKVSPGCKFCYAEVFANKYNLAKWGPNTERYLTTSTWNKPIMWNKRAFKENRRYRVFCSSLSDVFEDRPELIDTRKKLFGLIKQTPCLDWLLLTKRPENIEKLLPEETIPQNVWIGATCCTQKEYDKNISTLKYLKEKYFIKVTFISFEPLLEFIHLHAGVPDWSIIGGESGFLKDARPMQLQWVKSMIAQIQIHKGLVFFKQTGSQLAKKLQLPDKKGDNIESLPEHLNWLKIQDVPKI